MIKWHDFNDSFFELPENTLHIWRLKFLDSLTQEQFERRMLDYAAMIALP